MAMPFVEWSRYYLNGYAVPPFVTATLMLLMGFVVLLRERASLESRLLFLTILAAGIWFYAFSGMYCSRDEILARWWAKAAYMGVPFIPAGVYHFTVTLLRLKTRWRRLVPWCWILSAFFAASIVGTDALISRVRHYWWGYYPQYGWLSVFYLTFFFVVMALSLLQYAWAVVSEPAGSLYRRRARLLLGAFCIASLGAVDYLPKYGIAVYPFGYIPVFIFLIFAAWVVWKYHLVDITVAFAAERIIETMKEPLVVCDGRGLVCVANQAACDTFGYSMKEILGASVETLAGDEARARAKLWRLIRADGIQQKEMLFFTRQKRPVHVVFFVSVLESRDGSLLGYVIVTHDMTERKRIEEQLKSLNETLEKRVIERTQQLESKLIEVEQLNKIMMGREERILELKETLRTLQLSNRLAPT